MKRTKIILTVTIILTAIIGVLLYNKSQMVARSMNNASNAIPVSVVAVDKITTTYARSFTGTITANNDVAIVSETEGKVTEVFAKVGDYKAAGAPLIQIDDELKKAAYETAEVNFEKTKKDLERFESLHQEKAVTDQQYENARLGFKSAEAQYIAARKQYKDTRITTPISGIVTARFVDVGAMVQSKMPVANVVDISKLKVKLNVPEYDAFHLKAGDNIQIMTDVYPGVKFFGEVTTISEKGDESHTYPVEIKLDNNRSHPLKAGMFANVSFSSNEHNEEVVIPREALLGSMKHPQVFVLNGTTAKLRDIVIGTEYGTRLSVLSGLTVGENVVINGQNNLKNNIPVTIVK